MKEYYYLFVMAGNDPAMVCVHHAVFKTVEDAHKEAFRWYNYEDSEGRRKYNVFIGKKFSVCNAAN